MKEYKIGRDGFLHRGNPCRRCEFAVKKGGGLLAKYGPGEGCSVEGFGDVLRDFGIWSDRMELWQEAVSKGPREMKVLMERREGSHPPVGWRPGRPETVYRRTVIEALRLLAEDRRVKICGVIFDGNEAKVKMRRGK